MARVVVVISSSCAGYGVCRSFFANFSSKIFFRQINSFAAPQYGFYDLKSYQFESTFSQFQDKNITVGLKKNL